eukprot:3688717-Prymnesium_polylepis.1
MPPASRIATLMPSLERASLTSAPAACSFCATVPLRASSTTTAMPRDSRISSRLSALRERCRSARTACSFCVSVPLRASETTTAMPRASRIITRCALLASASCASESTACSLCALLPDALIATSFGMSPSGGGGSIDGGGTDGGQEPPANAPLEAAHEGATPLSTDGLLLAGAQALS